MRGVHAHDGSYERPSRVQAKNRQPSGCGLRYLLKPAATAHLADSSFSRMMSALQIEAVVVERAR